MAVFGGIMNYDIDELKKIFNFIFENDIDHNLFTNNFLIMLKNIIGLKEPNDFVLSKKQEDLLVYMFLDSNEPFDESTPMFLCSNKECIDASIERNIDSVRFVKNIGMDVIKKVMELVMEKDYILNENSPSFLRDDYDVVLKSIKSYVYSANYVNWDILSDEKKNYLIDYLIKENYLLSYDSPKALSGNQDIVYNSIKNKISTIRYSTNNVKFTPKIFKYLVKYDYIFNEIEIRSLPLSMFMDEDILKYFICNYVRIDKYESCRDFFDRYYVEEVVNKYVELIINGLNNGPSIKAFSNIFDYCSDLDWEDHKRIYVDDYANVFGKICSCLENNSNFDSAVNEMLFLKNMKNNLEEKYSSLVDAMKEYHRIIHSDDGLDKIDNSRDTIARLSALYVSICKEKYKWERQVNNFKYIKNLFIPKKDNPVVYKKVMEYKYKEKFRELYLQNDEEIIKFIDNILVQYGDIVDKDTIQFMIYNFINNGYSKIDKFISTPCKWNVYTRYEEAVKLVRRLNKKFIKYTDKEVSRYLDIIKYNEEFDEYCYSGPCLNEEDIIQIEKYKKYIKVFDIIKQQIILKSKTLKIDEEITDDYLRNIQDNLPFNDKYFEFNKSNIKNFNYTDFISGILYNTDFNSLYIVSEDEVFNFLNDFFVKNGFMWLLLIMCKYRNSPLGELALSDKKILKVIDNSLDIVKLSKLFDYDLSNIEDVYFLSNFCECTDDRALAILSKDIVVKLCNYLNYTDGNTSSILTAAMELVCQMAKKNKSTVPYVSGKTDNYLYSVYDSRDDTILTSGIDTNACFKIGGNDNDFFHYCALDKNGVVIKITDYLGNFIGRAAGFRNGNVVYFNQLRTIYDDGGGGYYGCCKSEKEDIIDIFKKACDDIIETSQKNKKEKVKIDFVFVTKSFAFKDYKNVLPRNIEKYIGDFPVEHESEDWINFVINTNNLDEVRINYPHFELDYGHYSIVCVSKSQKYKNSKSIEKNDIVSRDVAAVYEMPRSKVIVTNDIDENIIKKINKINGIYSYYDLSPYMNVKDYKDSTVFVGDNWYIIYNDGIVNSCVLSFDKKAVREYEFVKKMLEEQKKNDNKKKVLKLL